MIRIKIISLQDTEPLTLEDPIANCIEKLHANINFNFIWAKDQHHLLELACKEPLLLGLDSTGTLMCSEKFAQFFAKEAIQGGFKAAFIIGGAKGLPEALKREIPLISLSPMTLTQEMTCLILIEQIHLALGILQKSAEPSSI